MSKRLTPNETAALIDAAELLLAGEVGPSVGLEEGSADERKLVRALEGASAKLKARLPDGFDWPWHDRQ